MRYMPHCNIGTRTPLFLDDNENTKTTSQWANNMIVFISVLAFAERLVKIESFVVTL